MTDLERIQLVKECCAASGPVANPEKFCLYLLRLQPEKLVIKHLSLTQRVLGECKAHGLQVEVRR